MGTFSQLKFSLPKYVWVCVKLTKNNQNRRRTNCNSNFINPYIFFDCLSDSLSLSDSCGEGRLLRRPDLWKISQAHYESKIQWTDMCRARVNRMRVLS